MATNLIETVRSFITPDVVDRASTHLGESKDNISKAITGGIPALFAGFIHRSETGDAQGLLTDAKHAAHTNLAETAATFFTGSPAGQPAGGGWISNLFGGKLSALTGALASFAGIRSGSAHSLVSLLGPLSLGVLGKHAIDNNLDAGGLSSFLGAQKSSIMAALPAGLNIGGLLGGGVPAGAVPKGEPLRQPRAIPEHPRRKSSLLWPVLAGIFALALIGYLLNRNRGGKEPERATTTTQQQAPSKGVTTVATPMTTKVKLPDGTELNAYSGGVEEKLVACLNDPACQAGRDRWFDFDNINFETGSARLTPASQVQVNNIVAILKAYPKAKIKIGGYTDKVGEEAANLKLSQARAEAVTNAIKAGGISVAQLEKPEGYGSAFAKVPATASDEARRVDRRIAVRLEEKR